MILRDADLVVCEECGGRFHLIAGNHLKFVHGITTAEYRRRHPGAATISDNYRAFKWGELVHNRLRPVPVSDERMLDLLQAEARKLGRSPTAREWDRRQRGRLTIPSSDAMIGRFGSWSAALEAAGLQSRRIWSWSESQIVAALQAEAKRLGHAPTASEWRAPPPSERGLPSGTVVARRFGSWNAALEAAGLPTLPSGFQHA
jgi:hypothetical protein